ncbi:glycosyltransferase family 4 protein [Microbacterium sp.]|uniref:glycosyltransferase family 4 protein n=1 Tax=Microbacterium sp. TaxID=51671 RepID=UPI003A8DFA04
MTTILVAHPGSELFGSDRMVLESVIGFVTSGARVVVAVPDSGPLDVELRTAGAEVIITPMLVLRKSLLKPGGWLTLLRDGLRGMSAAWRLIGRVKPDVVYVSTIIIPQWPVVSRLRGRRTISHIHEAEASGNRLINVALYLPHLASYSTVVNSRFSLETIRAALPALARRASVIYNGVASPENPTPPRTSLEGPLRILYVGRLSPRKGVDLVISSAAILQARGRDVAVTLLGTPFTGYEWYEQQLRDMAVSAGVDVHFAGFHPSVWSFLADSDVLMVPSRVDEPFGNTAVEGVLALRPVIASDSSGLREAAGGYQTTLLVMPDDAAPFAAALGSVVTSWADLIARTSESRTEAVRRHSPVIYRRRIAAAVLGQY